MNKTDIQSVKFLPAGGWLVNGVLNVPGDPRNLDAQAVQDWIEDGNTPEGETIDEARARRCGEINALRDAKLAAGFSYAPLDAVFDAGASTQLRITAIAAGAGAGKGLPGGLSTIGFWDAANVSHTMTEAEFLDFAAAHRDWTAVQMVTARAHKDAINALTTVEAVDAYDIEAGW